MTLALVAGGAVVVLQTASLDAQPASELLRCRRAGDIDQFVSPGGQLVAHLEWCGAQRAAEGVEVLARHRPVSDRGTESWGRLGRDSSIQESRCRGQADVGRTSECLLRERRNLGDTACQTQLLALAPRQQAPDISDGAIETVSIDDLVVEGDDRVDQTMNDCNFHLRNPDGENGGTRPAGPAIAGKSLIEH